MFTYDMAAQTALAQRIPGTDPTTLALIPPEGKPDRETRPLPQFAGDLDRTAMEFSTFFGDRQAKPGALDVAHIMGAVEVVKNPR